MGGGRERLLYAIARHVKLMTVTDLYSSDTPWECARTEDPDLFVKESKPFPVDDGRIRAMRMDMRSLEFPEKTFDFCYSSCAIEHIGVRDDFIRHFNEVARVLKDDGLYVLTTEVQHGHQTIEDPHNFVFAPHYLNDLIMASDLDPEGDCDARMTPHKINYPLPSNLNNLMFMDTEHLAYRFFQESPHLHLLRGKFPFTTCAIVLRKRRGQLRRVPIDFLGLDTTASFMESGLREYAAVLQDRCVTLNPFSSLPGETSRFYLDHENFLGAPAQQLDETTVFHTDYFWWGTGARTFSVSLLPAEGGEGDCDIELRVHRYKTLVSTAVDCVLQTTIQVSGPLPLVRALDVQVDDAYSYAVLAKVRRGACRFRAIEVSSFPSWKRMEAPGFRTPFASRVAREDTAELKSP